MANDELNLDEELNENLDFLEEHELNLNESGGGYLSPTSSSFGANKIKFITIGIIVGIIILAVSMHIKKKSHHTTLTPITQEQPSPISSANKQITLPKNTQPNPVPEITQTPESTQTIEQTPPPNTNNSLSWQDLKKTVEETTTTPPSHSNFEVSLPVAGFEHPATTSPINKNSPTQESINEFKTTIDNITTDLTANVNQIKELQNNLKEILRSISNVNNNINNVDSKILNLTNTVDNLSINIKKYTQEEDLDLTANVRPSEPDLFSNTPEYLVHAVIPGRAWLKSSSGQIITVAEGDSLGDYGKIALIDTANNLVRTSSGVVFR